MDGTLTTAKIPSPQDAAAAKAQRGWFVGRQGRKLREALLAYLFLLPAFLIVGLFGLFPLLFAAYQSTLRGINNIVGTFNGLGNYVTAIASLTYVLGFWGCIGLILYSGYVVWQARKTAAANREHFWGWLPSGVLIGGGVVSATAAILTLLPVILKIPDTLRGAQATRANFQAAMWQAFLDPQVQMFFWGAVVALALGVFVQRFVQRRPSHKAEPASYGGTFTLVTILLALAATLGYLTWQELSGAYAEAFASGETFDTGTQIITMSAGILVLLVSWLLWSSASGRDSTTSTILRLVGAAALLVAAWMLFAEIPLAISRGDSTWWNGLLATFYYSLGTIPPQLLIALFLATLLFQKIRGRGIFRMLYFLPYIAPFVGTAAVFRILFSSRPTGPVNSIITALGLDRLGWLNEPAGIFDMLAGSVNLPGWASGPSLALVVIMIYGIWSFFGFNTVIFLAGLGSIPTETYEAAAIDGAGRWAQFRSITLPLLSPTLYFLTLYSVIGTFKAFNHIYVLRTGAALGTTDTASVVIFQAFKRDLRFGYASALAILLLLIIIVLTVVNNRIASKRVFYG